MMSDSPSRRPTTDSSPSATQTNPIIALNYLTSIASHDKFNDIFAPPVTQSCPFIKAGLTMWGIGSHPYSELEASLEWPTELYVNERITSYKGVV